MDMVNGKWGAYNINGGFHQCNNNGKFESGDEIHQVKQKLTLIAVLKGKEAKAVNRARKDGFSMIYDRTKSNLNFYKVATVEDKIIQEEKK